MRKALTAAVRAKQAAIDARRPPEAVDAGVPEWTKRKVDRMTTLDLSLDPAQAKQVAALLVKGDDSPAAQAAHREESKKQPRGAAHGVRSGLVRRHDVRPVDGGRLDPARPDGARGHVHLGAASDPQASEQREQARGAARRQAVVRAQLRPASHGCARRATARDAHGRRPGGPGGGGATGAGGVPCRLAGTHRRRRDLLRSEVVAHSTLTLPGRRL